MLPQSIDKEHVPKQSITGGLPAFGPMHVQAPSTASIFDGDTEDQRIDRINPLSQVDH